MLAEELSQDFHQGFRGRGGLKINNLSDYFTPAHHYVQYLNTRDIHHKNGPFNLHFPLLQDFGT
jgi:hypothetical protein